MSILKHTQIATNILRIGNHPYGFDCIFTENGISTITMSFQHVCTDPSSMLTERDIQTIEDKFADSLERFYKISRKKLRRRIKSSSDHLRDKQKLANKADKQVLTNKADKQVLTNKADKQKLASKADKQKLASKADKQKLANKADK